MKNIPAKRVRNDGKQAINAFRIHQTRQVYHHFTKRVKLYQPIAYAIKTQVYTPQYTGGKHFRVLGNSTMVRLGGRVPRG
jgi:hypothetical protein